MAYSIEVLERPPRSEEGMDKFIVNGGKKLAGSIKVSGSKNAALPIIAAALLAEKGKSHLTNVPDLADIHTMIGVLRGLGAKIEFDPARGTMTIDAAGINSHIAPYDLVRKMRASFLVMGPLLGRLGKARVSLPGGCVLGPRPVDQHVLGFKRLGAKITESRGYINAVTEDLAGTEIFFDRPSHTGTENIMMAAALAKGTTVIINAACDPEVVDLAEFLNKIGAKISGAGTTRMEISGVKRLNGADHSVMPDRLVAGTFLLALAACGGKVELKDARFQDLEIVLDKLVEAGVDIKHSGSRITASATRRPGAFRVTTYPFPGFPTDLQAATMAMACVSKGTSYIRETVFTERFTHVMEMQRLGAQINVSGDEAIVTGTDRMQGASVMMSDIRAGAGLVLATMAAHGESEILRIYHVDRGYEKIEEKFQALGGNIKRIAV
jgi:UDP-N-acetylglucosamine 1-carboxyvinyltransferase